MQTYLATAFAHGHDHDAFVDHRRRGDRPLLILSILSIDVSIERSHSKTNHEAASIAETGCFLRRLNTDGQDGQDEAGH
jgi:hypothetical protein